MPRVKKGFKARRRRNRILKVARGFRGGRSKLWRSAVEAVRRAWVYAYKHRRVRKRDFRRLWITRINAASRQYGLKYSMFIAGLNRAGVQLDRKMLSELAVSEPRSFEKIVEIAREA
ncbi:MAG: 50S ribosomal protein L20 [bacterium]